MTVTVPISRFSYASKSADEAWDALSRMYTGARPHASSPEAAVRFDTAATPDLAVDRGWLHSAEGAFDASPDQLNIISVLSGRINLDFGRHGTVSNLPGDSYLYLPHSPAHLTWDDFDALPVRLPRPLVARAAAELTGLSADALRFTSPRPLSAAHTRFWLRTAKMLWQQLSEPDSLAENPLIHQELLNTTTAALVSVFPNTALTRGYVPGPGDVRPAALRRAIAYIDAHASLPITVTDVADAAGTNARALRAAFRRHLDTTPTAYLRRARLEAAHHDLQTTDPTGGDTVAAIAARWGFARSDRFAAAYRQVFGVTPDHTLST